MTSSLPARQRDFFSLNGLPPMSSLDLDVQLHQARTWLFDHDPSPPEIYAFNEFEKKVRQTDFTQDKARCVLYCGQTRFEAFTYLTLIDTVRMVLQVSLEPRA